MAIQLQKQQLQYMALTASLTHLSSGIRHAYYLILQDVKSYFSAIMRYVTICCYVSDCR